MGKLHLARGRIKVYASGYWFTSGGEKGAFGFYPHLKDEAGNAVYPDTQIHGDLRMAAQWLMNLNGKSHEEVNKYFGSVPSDKEKHSNNEKYRDLPSRIFIGDLKPNDLTRFQVKPRTEIDPNRTNKENMLVNLELAYYCEGSELCANIYVDYFDDATELQKVKDLISESAQLLSGFGAFRSRGYGRGSVEVEWFGDLCVSKDDYNEQSAKQSEHGEFLLFLKPLLNFRNKEIEPGKGQLVRCRQFIASSQIRGWFVKQYEKIFGYWPSVDDMKTISFSDFYPSKSDKLAYPPPMSTMKFENGDTVDLCKRSENDKSTEESEEKKRGKAKPLLDTFLTAEAKPQPVELKTEKRMRNSIEDDFSSKKEGGLFAQEFITTENIFGGKIKIIVPGSDFGKKVYFILSNLMPIINGCVFQTWMQTKQPNNLLNEQISEQKSLLVVSPIDYDNTVMGDTSAQISIASHERYNVTLKRPRRNRIVVIPGSVLSCDKGDKTIEWPAFGEEFDLPKADDSDGKESPKDDVKLTGDVVEAIKKMSRSQAGQLKEFLPSTITFNFLSKIVQERLDKYEKWNNKETFDRTLVPKLILDEIKNRLGDEQQSEKEKGKRLDAAKKFINQVHAKHRLNGWDRKQAKVCKDFIKDVENAGYRL